MLHSSERIIKHKLGLLNLAQELGNVSRACKVMGLAETPSTGTGMRSRKEALRPYWSPTAVARTTRIGWRRKSRRR